MVRITTGENNTLVGMISMVRDYRINVPGKVEVQMEERRAGAPEAEESWAYPSDPHGFQLVYPVKSTPDYRT